MHTVRAKNFPLAADPLSGEKDR